MARKFLAILSLCFFLTITFSISVLALTVIDSFDSPDRRPRDLAFDGTYLWLCGSYSSIDNNYPLYKLDTSGNVIDYLEFPEPSSDGLAFDGTYLWYTGQYNHIDNYTLIYKLDTSGNIIDSFDSPAPSPKGLAFDGTYLWLSEFSFNEFRFMIYKLDTSGNVIDSFDLSSAETGLFGLAFDGTYLWLCGYILPQLDTEATLYKLDTSGNIIDSFDSPDGWPQGLAFDGTYLWLSGGYSDKIYKLDIRTITSTSSTTSIVASTSSTTSTVPDPTTTTCTGPCCSELIYGEHSEQTELLRYIRDNVLSQTPQGQEVIKLYCQWSPAIVEAMGEDEELKEEVKKLVDGVLMLIVEVAE